MSGSKCAEALQEVHARNKGSQESTSFRDGSAEEGAVTEKTLGEMGGSKPRNIAGVWGRFFLTETGTLSLSSSMLAFDHFKNFPRVSSEIHPTTRSARLTFKLTPVKWVFLKIGVVLPPKSSIFIEFSIIHHPFWGAPIFGNTQMLSPL